jgi:hypothetical protein
MEISALLLSRLQALAEYLLAVPVKVVFVALPVKFC